MPPKSAKASTRSRTPASSSSLFDHLSLLDPDSNLFPEASNTPLSSQPSKSQSTAMDKELELARLQKEKLTLELEVLRLRKATIPTDTPPTSSMAEAKKRTIDWPHDYVPGTATKLTFESLDLASFVTGFLAMVKKYDQPAKDDMHAILEVLMQKAIHFSWPSVRGFYGFLAKQVELRRLEWSASSEIREMAATFFKHSELRPTKATSSNAASTSTGDGKFSCRDWNYKGDCACDATAASHAAKHFCRVCKSTDHPMLHCALRKMEIPTKKLLPKNPSVGTSLTITDTDSDLDKKMDHSSTSITAVIAHMIASRFSEPNAFGAKVPVTSQLNIPVWRDYLADYPDQHVLDFLQFGWPINFDANFVLRSALQNHNSALSYHSHVQHYLDVELDFGAIAGPFPTDPLNHELFISPLQTVPKRGSDKRRVVMDLSFPHGASVNDGISKSIYLGTEFKLRLPGIDRLCEFVISKGSGCLLYKKDLCRAYRQFPVDPKDYQYLGFQWNGHGYFDTRCPFGLRSSAMICQRTTKAVIHIFTREGFTADVYLDDFYGAERPNLAHEAFARLQSLFNELGLQSSQEKDCPPHGVFRDCGRYYLHDQGSSCT